MQHHCRSFSSSPSSFSSSSSHWRRMLLLGCKAKRKVVSPPFPSENGICSSHKQAWDLFPIESSRRVRWAQDRSCIRFLEISSRVCQLNFGAYRSMYEGEKRANKRADSMYKQISHKLKKICILNVECEMLSFNLLFSSLISKFFFYRVAFINYRDGEKIIHACCVYNYTCISNN